jgi:hypothetical protein
MVGEVLTCSGVTGFWEVLCSSSIVFWSNRKSFLQPTRMMGRPWQKCSTSEIHCAAVSGPHVETWARVPYLLLDVVERIRRIDGEANQDNVRVGVRKRAETIVIFLASSIPKGELHVFAINLDVGDVVLKDGGDVDLLRTSLLVSERRRLCACCCCSEGGAGQLG